MDGSGFRDRFLTAEEIRAIVRDGLASLALAGKRVLFIIPDGTRTMPMPQFFALFEEELAGKVAALDFLVALGTHQPMSDAQLTPARRTRRRRRSRRRIAHLQSRMA